MLYSSNGTNGGTGRTGEVELMVILCARGLAWSALAGSAGTKIFSCGWTRDHKMKLAVAIVCNDRSRFTSPRQDLAIPVHWWAKLGSAAAKCAESCAKTYSPACLGATLDRASIIEVEIKGMGGEHRMQIHHPRITQVQLRSETNIDLSTPCLAKYLSTNHHVQSAPVRGCRTFRVLVFDFTLTSRSRCATSSPLISSSTLPILRLLQRKHVRLLFAPSQPIRTSASSVCVMPRHAKPPRVHPYVC